MGRGGGAGSDSFDSLMMISMMGSGASKASGGPS